MTAARHSRLLGLLGPLAGDGLAQLAADWRQHLLTGVGLVWGSAAVVLLLSLGAGFYDFLDLGFKKTGDRYTLILGAYTTAESGGARPGRRIVLDWEDYLRVRASAPSASHVAAELMAAVALRTPFRTRTGSISAATPDIRHIKVLEVERGRFYDDGDVRRGRAVAVLGANLPAIYFGDQDPLGRTISIGGRPFQVIGVLARKGDQLVVNNALHDDMAFVPLPAGRRALGSPVEVGAILVNPRARDDWKRVQAEARSVLHPRHHVAPGDDEAFWSVSIAEFSGPLIRIAVGLTLLLGAVGTVTLAIAAIGVANLMIALVNARRIELAVRRACGARRADLVVQLLIETGIVVGAGGALGIAAAVGLVLGIGALPLPESVPDPSLSPSVLVTTCAVLMATGLVAGVAPARLAARVDPATALRAT